MPNSSNNAFTVAILTVHDTGKSIGTHTELQARIELQAHMELQAHIAASTHIAATGPTAGHILWV